MKTKYKQPLLFFEDLLESNKSKELKNNFLSGFAENSGLEIKSINEDQGIVKYIEAFHDLRTDDVKEGLVTKVFKNEFAITIRSESINSNNEIEEFILNITANGNNPTEFINLQIHILKDLLIKSDLYYSDFPYVKNAILKIILFIQDKYLKEKLVSINLTSPNQLDIEDYSELSFNWDSHNPEDTIPTLERLFELLTDKLPIIESTKEDFLRAFTKRKIENGIKWLIKGKNPKYTSKSSLFYFINYLNDNGYIDTVPSTELSRMASYIFRDFNGQKLKNLNQSKSYESKNPSRSDALLEIFEQLA